MSYDINFWKPKADTPQPPAVDIYRRITPGELLPELETLPVDTIIDALRDAFPGYDPSEDFPLVELPEGSMEVSSGPQSFRFDFRGPETGEEKAAVWRIMSGFGCVCYDPQSDTLYTAKDPPPYRKLTPDEARRVEAAFGGRDIASMMRHMQKRRAQRALLGCGAMLAGGFLLAAVVVAAIVYLLI